MPILDGVTVLDFTQGFAGSLATMLLADNGAEVLKVEPPGGDPYRAEPAWIMWNRGKRSVTLDLESDAGRRNARRLTETVDVVVDTFLPGEAQRAGLGYESLAAANPRLISCSITGLGSMGEYAGLPAYEGLIAAKSGDYVQLARMGGGAGERPLYRARPNGSYGAAHFAVQGIVAALRARAHSGLGQRVETSLFQGLVCYDSNSALQRQIALGLTDVTVASGRGQQVANIPYLVVRCKDGQWMQMTNLASRLFPNWMRAIGLSYILDDARFSEAPFAFKSDADVLELRHLIHTAMLQKTFDEWIEIFTREDVAGDRFVTTQQAMDHPQLRALGAVVEIDDPAVGRTEQIGPFAHFSATPVRIGAPAPLPGADTAAVLARSAAPASASAGDPPATNPALRHPLQGLLVLDFASWLAAPVGSSLLADLGARVIKVEPLAGDEFRPFSQGRGRTFQGKESLVVDLKTPQGQEVVRALLAKADGLLHNMRGGAPKRLGIDYESVCAVNPHIAYVYGASYGSMGPGAGRGAFHPIGGALSGGVLWQLGRNNEPPPNDEPLTLDQIAEMGVALYRANEGSPDVTSAIAVGTAMTLALYEKERTGRGQYVETRMLVSNCYICSDDFVRYRGKQPRLELDEYRHGTHALHRLYETAEGWCFVDCERERDWAAFCTALDRPDLRTDARFASRDLRLCNDDQLVALLGLLFRTASAAEWEQRMRAHAAPCVRADELDAADFLLSDPSVIANGYAVEVSHPITGRMWRQGPAVQFSRTPGVAGPANGFGEQGPAILRELGYSESRIRELAGAGVVFWPDMAQSGAAGSGIAR